MKIIDESWNAHIAAQTKQQAAYSKLKTAIISLTLPPNTVLAERYIMEKFELSRTPMREAVNQLLTEGFITNIAGKGFIVNDLQYKDFQEIYEVKEALESEAAYLFCIRKTNQNIANIEKVFLAYQDNIKKKKYIKALLLDLDFHWAIVKGANNQRIEREMSVIMDQTLKFFNMYYTDEVLPVKSGEIFMQHTSILDCIKGDDPDAARMAVLTHIKSIKEFNRNNLFL